MRLTDHGAVPTDRLPAIARVITTTSPDGSVLGARAKATS